MDLIFQTSAGNPFCIEVGYFDTVLEIKEKIEKDQGIPISKQTLIFNNNVLNDDLNIHNSDILDRSRIHLTVAANEYSPQSKISLILKMPASKPNIAVEMDLKDTIQKLKEKIHEMEGIPMNRLVIHANGVELHDHKSMQELGFTDNSEVTVGIQSSSGGGVRSSSSGNVSGSTKLRVVVLTIGAEKIPVEVNSLDNVGELRKKLQKMKLNLPQEGYFFIYKQNVMDDDRSFRWHHVCQGDVIEIFSGSVSGGS